MKHLLDFRVISPQANPARSAHESNLSSFLP